MDGTYHSDEGALLPEPEGTLLSMTSVLYNNKNSDFVLNGFEKDETAKDGIRDIFKNGFTAKKEGDSIIFKNIYGSRISLQYKKTNTLADKMILGITGNLRKFLHTKRFRQVFLNILKYRFNFLIVPRQKTPPK